MYRPDAVKQMTTPMTVYRTEEKYELGVLVKQCVKLDDIICNFKTYGGTEKEVNGVIAVEDTATIVTWYRPDITSDCILERIGDGARFEILGEPENIEQRNMILSMKVRRIKGGA